MIAVTPGATPKKAPVDPKTKKPATVAAAKAPQKKHGFFSSEPVTVDAVANEEAEAHRQARMQKIVFVQSCAIAVLVVFFFLAASISKPIHHYYARNPDGTISRLDSSSIPNLTHAAILAWATTSVTEVMTFGFGDILEQLNIQKPRFTPEGWKSFSDAFYRQSWNARFKQNRLVVTTVPSDTAVLMSEGPNENGVYQWKVQVPVIMNYLGSNDTPTPHHEFITLTIERVPPSQNPVGIAIRNWVTG